MTKVVWLPNETDYYEFVAPNTPYSFSIWLCGYSGLSILDHS